MIRTIIKKLSSFFYLGCPMAEKVIRLLQTPLDGYKSKDVVVNALSILANEIEEKENNKIKYNNQDLIGEVNKAIHYVVYIDSSITTYLTSQLNTINILNTKLIEDLHNKAMYSVVRNPYSYQQMLDMSNGIELVDAIELLQLYKNFEEKPTYSSKLRLDIYMHNTIKHVEYFE